MSARRVRGVVLALTLACGMCAQAGQASAQSSSAAAEKLFQEGRQLFGAKRFAEAIEKFRASQNLEPKVGVLLSIGDSFEKLGKVASAWSSYVAARDLARAQNDPRLAETEQRIKSVEGRLPKLTVRVTAPPPGIGVKDNGITLPPASFDSALPVDPGAHEIIASAKGRRTFKTTIDLAEAQSRDVVVPALEQEDDRFGHVAMSPPPPKETDDTQRNVGVGLLVGGGVVTVAGLVFGGLAIGKWGTVTDTCPDKHCPTEADRQKVDDDRSTASTFATISTIGVIAGVVAAGTGLTLMLTSPSKSVALAPTAGDRALGLSLTLRP